MPDIYIQNRRNGFLDVPASIMDLDVRRNIPIPPDAQLHIQIEDKKALEAFAERLDAYGISHSDVADPKLPVIHAPVVAPAKGK